MTKSKNYSKYGPPQDGGDSGRVVKSSQSITKQAARPKIWAVRVGRRVGIFDCIEEYNKSVEGFPMSNGKMFKDRELAEEWLKEGVLNLAPTHPSTTAPEQLSILKRVGERTTSSDTLQAVKRNGQPSSKIWAVRVGRRVGIFDCIEEYNKSVEGFAGYEGKVFKQRELAEVWLKGEFSSAPSVASPFAVIAPSVASPFAVIAPSTVSSTVSATTAIRARDATGTAVSIPVAVSNTTSPVAAAQTTTATVKQERHSASTRWGLPLLPHTLLTVPLSQTKKVPSVKNNLPAPASAPREVCNDQQKQSRTAMTESEVSFFPTERRRGYSVDSDVDSCRGRFVDDDGGVTAGD